MDIRAEIIETGIAELKSASIIINAPAADVFNLLADPHKHSVIDGSKSVQGVLRAPKRRTRPKIAFTRRSGSKKVRALEMP